MVETKICNLIVNFKRSLEILKLAPGTLENYTKDYLPNIQRFFLSTGRDLYDQCVIQDYLQDLSKKESTKVLSHSYCNDLRRTAIMLKDYATSNKIVWKVYCNTRKFVPNTGFLSVIEELTNSYNGNRVLDYNLRRFCCFLEDNGYENFSVITDELILQYISEASLEIPKSMESVVYSLCALVSYLKSNGIGSLKIDPSILKPVSRGRKILPYFTRDDVLAILRAIDRNTDAGIRDYAIVMLAANTALRAVDIRKLKLTSINWETYEITVIQSKTNRVTKISLDSPTGNAIGDYILKARPNVKSEYVFLRSRAPFLPLKNSSSLNSMVHKYFQVAGIEIKHNRGFHAFRRSVAKWMTDAGISKDTISEVLGHDCLGTAKVYIPTDLAKLKDCALGFEDVPVIKGAYA